MRAVVLESFGAPPSVQEVSPLPLGPDHVRVSVGASGVCHTDLSVLRGNYPLATPLILGHEGAGRVVDVGRDVRTLAMGDRVIAAFVSTCDECWQCRRGRTNLCELSATFAAGPRARQEHREMAALGGLGTMAEVMTVHRANLVRVETDLPDEILALIGCGVTSGVGAALWSAGVVPGATVAVFGIGGVGAAALQGSRLAGARQIIAVDPVAEKRHMAARFGATHSVDPSVGDVSEQIRELTDGRGVDYAIEVVGHEVVMRQAYDSACRGGTVVYVGGLPGDRTLSLPANDIHVSGKTLIGSSLGSARVRRDMQTLVGLVEAGRIDVESMISKRLAIDDVNVAFDRMVRGEGIRTVLVPGHLTGSISDDGTHRPAQTRHPHG
jgi:S-(hydroxymethyl)glutathione dehydrogenase/alcohol dehydrogenase